MLLALLLQILGVLTLFNVLTTPLLNLWRYLWRKPSIKHGPDEWSLVTGASSGIGEALTLQLADHGFNVVLIAHPDSNEKLDDMCTTLSSLHSGQEFRKICVDLAETDSIHVIDRQTSDVLITLVFCNAGIMSPYCGFVTGETDEWIKLLNVNVVSQVAVSHIFMKRLAANGQKGTIMFSSSATAHLPSPTVALYSASKALLSHLALSLSVETRWRGIRVLAMLPSYTSTNLYNYAPYMSILQLFRKIWPSSSDSVALQMLAAVNCRPILSTVGWYGVVTQMASKLIDDNVMVEILEPIMRLSSDFRRDTKMF